MSIRSNLACYPRFPGHIIISKYSHTICNEGNLISIFCIFFTVKLVYNRKKCRQYTVNVIKLAQNKPKQKLAKKREKKCVKGLFSEGAGGGGSSFELGSEPPTIQF